MRRREDGSVELLIRVIVWGERSWLPECAAPTNIIIAAVIVRGGWRREWKVQGRCSGMWRMLIIRV